MGPKYTSGPEEIGIGEIEEINSKFSSPLPRHRTEIPCEIPDLVMEVEEEEEEVDWGTSGME